MSHPDHEALLRWHRRQKESLMSLSRLTPNETGTKTWFGKPFHWEALPDGRRKFVSGPHPDDLATRHAQMLSERGTEEISIGPDGQATVVATGEKFTIEAGAYAVRTDGVHHEITGAP